MCACVHVRAQLKLLLVQSQSDEEQNLELNFISTYLRVEIQLFCLWTCVVFEFFEYH